MEEQHLKERRSERRTRLQQYHSAEFILEEKGVNYQFRIRDTTSSSMGVLVKENSEVLPLLRVGETLRVKYYSSKSQDELLTIIRHVTKNDEGHFKGHYLVGLEVLSHYGAVS